MQSSSLLRNRENKNGDEAGNSQSPPPSDALPAARLHVLKVELPKPAPRDSHPAARLHCKGSIVSPKQCHQLGTKCSNAKPRKRRTHSNHHTNGSGKVQPSRSLQSRSHGPQEKARRHDLRSTGSHCGHQRLRWVCGGSNRASEGTIKLLNCIVSGPQASVLAFCPEMLALMHFILSAGSLWRLPVGGARRRRFRCSDGQLPGISVLALRSAGEKKTHRLCWDSWSSSLAAHLT
eukprot:XP_008764885.1 PREDICTED: uncharacterized protein LOC102546514 isoform X1 [Rattus norvegicus]